MTLTPISDTYFLFLRRPAIINESSISNTRGTVAIVPDDPSDPNSATSQFLINLSDNSSFLDSENGGLHLLTGDFCRLVKKQLPGF